MTYGEYIEYHKRGDAGIEENMIARLSSHFKLSRWDSFRLVYYYSLTYHIPSALKLLRNHNTHKEQLVFRTDRRHVQVGDRFEKCKKQLNQGMLLDLDRCTTSRQQYDVVIKWYYFGRYAAFLFLEVWLKLSGKQITDNYLLEFEQGENYRKGAEIITGSAQKSELKSFVERVKADTGDNVFSIETSLCAVAKIKKGTRWNGYYTQRMLENIKGTEYEQIIINLL